MEKIKLPNIDIEATRVALGTWAIGGWLWGGSDDNESLKTIRYALDSGINMIDTAPAYGLGKSEELIGKIIKEYGNRDKVIIASKVGLEWERTGSKIRIWRNSSKKRILREIDDSLKRLQTDFIDIYQVHWPDKRVPFEETAETLYKLMLEGKIRAIGVSNFSPEQIDEFRKEAPIHTSQPPYNLFEREIEKDVLPYCLVNNIAVLAYGPLCKGLLSGKMALDRQFVGDDLRKDNDTKFQKPQFEYYLKTVEKLDEYAFEKFGKSVIHLALRWILDRNVEIALWGARKPKQLEPLSGVWDWSLDERSSKEIDEIIKESIPEELSPELRT